MLVPRLPRYVVAEFLKSFALALGAITLFMLLVVVVREATREGLGLGDIARILPFVLPVAMQFTLPASTLLAICAVYGRMAADNEFVAVKSLGISPVSMIKPTLIVVFFVSIGAVWLNDLAVSWGIPGLKRVVVESIEKIAYRTLKARGQYSNDDFSISVDAVDGERLIYPMLVIHGEGSQQQTIVRAREAILKRNPVTNGLMLDLVDVSARRKGDFELHFSKQHQWELPVLTDKYNDQERIRPSNVGLSDIPGQSQLLKSQIRRRQKAVAALGAFHLIRGDFEELDHKTWRSRIVELSRNQHRLRRLELEPWRRWANGFCCFFFAMIGIPWSIRTRSANLFTTFAWCFIPILLVYYPLFQFGLEWAKSGHFPPYGVWIGNLTCLLVGFVLLQRVVRY